MGGYPLLGPEVVTPAQGHPITAFPKCACRRCVLQTRQFQLKGTLITGKKYT